MNYMRLKSFSEYRLQLMGVATLIIMLFHCSAIEFLQLPILNLAKYGFSGVDIFFLLSGMGLCYSWNKNPNYALYIKKRIARIIPTYWIVLILFHMGAIMLHMLFSSLGKAYMLGSSFNYPHTIWQCLSFYFGGIGYFFTTDNHYFYEWYVPTQILFYLIAPLMIVYGSSLKKSISVLLCACLVNLFCAILWYNNTGGGGLHWLSFSRLPIFTLGFVLYHAIQDEKAIYAKCLVSISIITMVACVIFELPEINKGLLGRVYMVCGYRFLIVPGLCLLLIPLFRIRIMNSCFSYLGTISLESFLVHIKLLPLLKLGLLGLVLVFLLTIPIARMLHLVALKIRNRFFIEE